MEQYVYHLDLTSRSNDRYALGVLSKPNADTPEARKLYECCVQLLTEQGIDPAKLKDEIELEDWRLVNAILEAYPFQDAFFGTPADPVVLVRVRGKYHGILISANARGPKSGMRLSRKQRATLKAAKRAQEGGDNNEGNA